jgi:Domain of Unknown Function (DUF1080)
VRTLVLIPAIGLLAALIGLPPAAGDDSAGWTDLLGRNLKDWSRIGDGKTPWRLTTDRSLICGPATDSMAPDNDFRNGTVQFEYRFEPTKFKTGYKASVTARWTTRTRGCKIDLGDDCGTLTGAFVAASDSYKELIIPPVEKPGRAPGQWNQVKLVMQDTSVKAVINGRECGPFERCMSDHGLVMFNAEGSEIQFRRIEWRAGK